MKILYVVTQSELGGAQKNVLDLALGLKDFYEIAVAAGPDGGGAFFKILEENKIRFIKLRLLRRAIKPISDLLAISEIRQLIKQERPDILHLHSSKAGVLGSLAARKINKCAPASPKVVYTVHGAVFEASFRIWWLKLFVWLEKYTARFKDKIICVSENDKKLWLRHQASPEQKLLVIHNGFDTRSLDFLEKDRALEKLFELNPLLFELARGAGPNLKIVGTIANFYPEKGLSFFIKAAALIKKQEEFKNILFLVIGGGSQKNLLEAMIKDFQLEKTFILAGEVKKAARYLKAFDIFVLPSVKEGLPYTILEAMAAGLPIVASYVGGIPEMVTNKENGFLVLSRSPEMLADKIAELLKNPKLAQQMGQNSQQKIKRFSLEKMIKETNKTYKNL